MGILEYFDDNAEALKRCICSEGPAGCGLVEEAREAGVILSDDIDERFAQLDAFRRSQESA